MYVLIDADLDEAGFLSDHNFSAAGLQSHSSYTDTPVEQTPVHDVLPRHLVCRVCFLFTFVLIVRVLACSGFQG
jgi:hypothetical protein